jgi:FlaA1/EpsC-like NDP-sugar epimerase
MDLAEDMIRFSGLEPGRDIAIELIGPRPGEKLHEQLFNVYETPEATEARKILRAARPAVDPAWVEYVFDTIGLLVAEGDATGLAAAVGELAGGRTVEVETSAERSGRSAS